MISKKSSVFSIFALFLIIHFFLYGFYLCMSVGIPDKTIYLQLRRYIPCALVVAFSVTLWRHAGLPTVKLWPHSTVALLWILTYPLSYWIVFHLNTNFIDNHYDIAIGAYLFCCMVCLHLLLLRYYRHSHLPGIIIGVLLTVLSILPVTQIVYFFNYGTPVSPAACLALLQTNGSEAREFILQNIGYGGIGFIIIFFGALLILFTKGASVKKNTVPLNKKTLIIILVLLLTSGAYGFVTIKKTGALYAFYSAKDYLYNATLFNKLHDKNFSDLKVTLPVNRPSRPSTVIIAIGESASRYYMSAYKNTERDNSPWMRTQSQNRDFILFRHAYASWGQTVPSLERALTEKNQYNTKEFHNSLTILDLAKKAGYETWWFSGQGTIDAADTPITLVAKTADHSAWLEDTLVGTTEKKYDGDLLPWLKQIDPSKNNFIVLHIMGSHDNYINRYPPEFTRWKIAGAEERIDEYDNSLAYTDKFLQDVHEYGVRYLNLQAMLYFSDHGANPLHKRHPELSDFISLRIPMFLYLSPEYQKLYPETTDSLRSHANSYFTNDLIYEMVAGILNIKSNHYDETNSFASPQYKYTRETLKTRLGKNSLAEDVDEDYSQK